MVTNKKSYLWRKTDKRGPVNAILASLQSNSTHKKGPGTTCGNLTKKGQACLLIRQRISTVPWTLCKEISFRILSLAFSCFFRSFPTRLLPEDLGREARWGLLRGSLQTPVSWFYLNLLIQDVFTSSPFYVWPFGLCPLSWLSSSN